MLHFYLSFIVRAGHKITLGEASESENAWNEGDDGTAGSGRWTPEREKGEREREIISPIDFYCATYAIWFCFVCVYAGDMDIFGQMDHPGRWRAEYWQNGHRKWDGCSFRNKTFGIGNRGHAYVGIQSMIYGISCNRFIRLGGKLSIWIGSIGRLARRPPRRTRLHLGRQPHRKNCMTKFLAIWNWSILTMGDRKENRAESMEYYVTWRIFFFVLRSSSSSFVVVRSADVETLAKTTFGYPLCTPRVSLRLPSTFDVVSQKKKKENECLLTLL